MEFGGRGITANIVSPGAADTEPLRAANPGAASDDEAARTALRRLGPAAGHRRRGGVPGRPGLRLDQRQNLPADGGLLP